MSKISKIKAFQILDSRGLPTIATKVYLDDGRFALASVPSGASTGQKEALELRDGEKEFGGKGVNIAIKNVNNVLAKLLEGKNVYNQEEIDQIMIDADGSEFKSNLGANAILSVSLAVAKAGARAMKIPLHQYFNDMYENISGNETDQVLPTPMLNILNGGEHADNNIDLQEFMIIPCASSFSESIRWASEIYWKLKDLLKAQNLSTAVGDEGGFAPNLESNEQALKLIEDAIHQNDLEPGRDVFISLDCAANEFFSEENYILEKGNKTLRNAEFVNYLSDLCAKYPIISIEDGIAENDLMGWKILTQTLGKKCQLVGDDLFVTNEKLLKAGIQSNVANSILIKYNQIGTITETIKCICLARKSGYTSIISHRSGETEDSSIADLAVGTGTKQIKTGAPCRSDRVAKYNRLLMIEAENSFVFGSKSAFKNFIKDS